MILKESRCGYQMVALCPECEAALKYFQVRCGIVLNVPGLWFYFYCVNCGNVFMADWITDRGVEGWHDVSEEIPLEVITKLEVIE